MLIDSDRQQTYTLLAPVSVQIVYPRRVRPSSSDFHAPCPLQLYLRRAIRIGKRAIDPGFSPNVYSFKVRQGSAIPFRRPELPWVQTSYLALHLSPAFTHIAPIIRVDSAQPPGADGQYIRLSLSTASNDQFFTRYSRHGDCSSIHPLCA